QIMAAIAGAMGRPRTEEDAKMDMTEVQIDRWLERGTKFFKTVARNPVVRGALLSRGLTDDELAQGWKFYSELHGFGGKAEARPATKQTAAAQAINEIDAWDAPTYSAAHAVLDARYPTVAQFLFDNLEATVGVAAVVGAQRFLDRLDVLRDGKAPAIDPDVQYAAVALLATRRIIDNQREVELRKLIDTARLGARPDEVIDAPEMDPRRRDVAEACIHWLHEWREVARVAINRRDFRIALGLAQRRQSNDEGEATEDTTAVSASN
ncbi:MAG TPA: hypothetical protein VIV60_20175, partial [Polyangiaceae bacterium]